jgi:hypothetical protein
MSERARYVDGLPRNLAAAANDALMWLETFRDQQAIRRTGAPEEVVVDADSRLERCIAALGKELTPFLPAQCETTGEEQE